MILATPNQMHCDQALACIAAGVPTLVEKPVAHTLEAGTRLGTPQDIPAVGRESRRDSARCRREETTWQQ